MRVTLGKKITGGFLLVALLLAIVGGISYVQQLKTQAAYSDLLNRQSTALFYTKDAGSQINLQNASLSGYLLTIDKGQLDTLQKTMPQTVDTIKQLESLIINPEQKANVNKLSELNKQFREITYQVVQLVQAKKLDQAIALNNDQVSPLGIQIQDLANKIVAKQTELIKEADQSVKSEIRFMTTLVVLLSAGAVVLAIIIGMGISRIISSPMVRLSAAAKQIASGDLTGTAIHLKRRDEIGELADSFQQMKENLRTLLVQIHASSEQVAASAEQLFAGTEQVSQATNHVAATIQGIAAGSNAAAHAVKESTIGMDEVARGFQYIAKSTAIVSETSLESKTVAEQGNAAIQQAINQMNTIQESVQSSSELAKSLGERSTEIGKFIDVITDISAQTNLLALNAAIEAARAGEHGRGFAVVADEVRKLAEESRNSAEQIVQLVNGIQQDTARIIGGMEAGTQEVESGVEMIHHAGEAFKRIMQSVQTVTSQAQEVLASTEQIAASADQVSASMDEMSTIADKNASESDSIASVTEEQLASMEEIATSASALTDLAEEMQQQVKKFIL